MKYSSYTYIFSVYLNFLSMYYYFSIDVTISIRVMRSTMCNILHPLYCACMHKGSRPEISASKMSRLYQQAAETLVYSGRYNCYS